MEGYPAFVCARSDARDTRSEPANKLPSRRFFWEVTVARCSLQPQQYIMRGLELVAGDLLRGHVTQRRCVVQSEALIGLPGHFKWAPRSTFAVDPLV